MGSCGGCGGDCTHCGGCARELTVTSGEVELLQSLGQIPFLPVARRMDDETPVYLEDSRHTRQEYSLILTCLEKKGLISLDFDRPLAGFSGEGYEGYPILGSMALTARGQQVLELLEVQGIS